MLMTEAAVRTLPPELPQFFREGIRTIAHCSVDPDAFKNRMAPQLTNREEPDHYFDLELLREEQLPDKRHAYIELCQRLQLKPAQVGYLPYSITEHTQMLTLALAEYRRFPDDPAIEQKVLVYAGLLAHYAADLSMPLHCTVHWNGKADPVTGKSPMTGIHSRIDALIEQLELTTDDLSRDIKLEAIPATPAGVLVEIHQSRLHIDATYELESLLPTKDLPITQVDPKVRAFALERGRHAVKVIAGLYLTAWRDSASVELPDWLIKARSIKGP